jgi:hypothetical protein
MDYRVDVVQDVVVIGQYQLVRVVLLGRSGALAATEAVLVVINGVTISKRLWAEHIILKVTEQGRGVHIEFVQAVFIDV